MCIRDRLKGISPRVTFIGLGGGVFFFVLEGAKKALGVDRRSTAFNTTVEAEKVTT